jgi:hypothetical protein
MEPEVRYFILCDDVQTDSANLLRVDIRGLISTIRSTARPAFPLVRPLLCVLIVLTGCRGTGEVSLRVIQAETGRIIFRNQPRRVRFSGAVEDVVGVVFRIKNCSFPAAGLYWVECIFSGAVIARQRFMVTASS